MIPTLNFHLYQSNGNRNQGPAQTPWQVQIHPQPPSAWTGRVPEEMQGRKNHPLHLKKLFCQTEERARGVSGDLIKMVSAETGLGVTHRCDSDPSPRALEMTSGTCLSWGLSKVSALPLQFGVPPRNKSNSEEKKWNCRVRAPGSLGDHPVIFLVMDGVKDLKNGRVCPGSQWVRGMNAANTPLLSHVGGLPNRPRPPAGPPQSTTEAVCTPVGDEKRHRNHADRTDSHSLQGPYSRLFPDVDANVLQHRRFSEADFTKCQSPSR